MTIHFQGFLLLVLGCFRKGNPLKYIDFLRYKPYRSRMIFVSLVDS